MLVICSLNRRALCPFVICRCAVADTGIPDKQDYTKIQSWLMLVGFKAYGQSPENGAKSLVYACCAPEEDLRGSV